MKKLSTTQLVWIGAGVVLLIIIAAMWANGIFMPATDPLDAFTVSKTCTFLQVEPPMAFCGDGTQYSVILVNVNPLGQ